MSEEEIKLQTYKVLKQLGWNKGIYAEGDTVEMEPRFAEYYLKEKVLKEAPLETSVQEELLDEEAPTVASQNIPTPTIEPEEI